MELVPREEFIERKKDLLLMLTNMCGEEYNFRIVLQLNDYKYSWGYGLFAMKGEELHRWIIMSYDVYANEFYELNEDALINAIERMEE